MLMKNRKNQCILVGNAVPPLLAANLANEIKRYLTKTNYVGHNEDLYLKKNEKIDIEIQKEKLSFVVKRWGLLLSSSCVHALSHARRVERTRY